MSCNRCGAEKTETNFGRGRLCKVCIKKTSQANYLKNRDARLKKRSEYRIRNLDRYRTKVRVWNGDNKEKKCAHQAVRRAVKSGRLLPAKSFTCTDLIKNFSMCGIVATSYDHYMGYSVKNRLVVEPVCNSCHRLRQNR